MPAVPEIGCVRCQARKRRRGDQPDSWRARQMLTGGVAAMEGSQLLFHRAKLLVHLFDHVQETAKDAPGDVRQMRGRSFLHEASQIGHFTNALSRNETEFCWPRSDKHRGRFGKVSAPVLK
jgi:hypothetical protein